MNRCSVEVKFHEIRNTSLSVLLTPLCKETTDMRRIEDQQYEASHDKIPNSIDDIMWN